MAATAQMQWTLSEHESQTTLKAWKDNLMCFLSQEEIFRPFLLPGVTWGKKTKRNPFRGFTGPDAASKTTILELILLRIAVFAPVLSRHTVVKNSTSLNSIWDSLCLYYGLDNFSEPNISLAQSSHQQSYKLYSGLSQTAPVPQETSQAQQDTIEHSENAPTSFTVHLSQSALVDDRIDQLRSSNLVTETPSTVDSSPQPTEEYIETPVDPHAGSSTSATNTFTESGVELCRQEMDDLAVHREEHSPFSSHLVFDSSELDLYLHPVKSSPQTDLHLDLSPGNHDTTHPHQQHEIAPFLLSSSHRQFVCTYSNSALGTDSSDTTWKSSDPFTLNVFPDSPYTYDQTDELESDVSSVQNNVKHEPELSVNDVEDLVTEPISEETPNPIDKLSSEPAIEELPRSNETTAFEPEKEEEDQISPKCTYDRDQDKCDDPNVSPLGKTIMTEPDEQKRTEETGFLMPADTEDMMNKSLAKGIPKPETNDAVAPEPKEHPQKVVEPSNANLPEPKSIQIAKHVEKHPDHVTPPDQVEEVISPKASYTSTMRPVFQPRNNGYSLQFSRDMLNKLDSYVIPHDSLSKWQSVASVRSPSQTLSNADMKVHESEDRRIPSGSSISPSMTAVQTPSDCDDAKSLATASSLSISSLHLKNDDPSNQGHLSTPVSVPHDLHVGDRGYTNTQTLLDHTHNESSSYPLFDLPETLSFTPHQSVGHIGHLSTSTDESQPKTPVSDHFKSMPVMHQPQGVLDTEHPRTQVQKGLQAVGIPHPSFTKIGLFCSSATRLVKWTSRWIVLCCVWKSPYVW